MSIKFWSLQHPNSIICPTLIYTYIKIIHWKLSQTKNVVLCAYIRHKAKKSKFLSKKWLFQMWLTPFWGSKLDPARARAKPKKNFFLKHMNVLIIHNIIIFLTYKLYALDGFLPSSSLFWPKTLIFAVFCTPPRCENLIQNFQDFFFFSNNNLVLF